MNLGVRRREIRYPATAGVNLGGRVWPKRSPSPRDRGCWTARPDIDSAWISLPPPHRFTPLRPRERFPPLSIRFSPGAQWRRSPRKTGSWDLASFAFVHVSTEKTKQRHVDRHNRGEDRPASAATVADPTTTLTGPFHQLRLALLSVVERMRSTPPDRGLYREALALALGSHRTFRHGGKTVHRRDVRNCARAMYFHRTAGFIVEGQTIAAIAAEIDRSVRVAQACVGVLQDRGFLSVSRPSRRKPATYAMPLAAWVRRKLEVASTAPRGPHYGGYVRTGDVQEEEEERALPLDDLTTTTTTAVSRDVESPPADPPNGATVPDADGSTPDPDPPTSKQLGNMADICAELGEPVPALATRRAAIPVVADLRRRRDASRAAAGETSRLDAKAEGRRNQGAARGRTFLDRVHVSAARCAACGVLNYPTGEGRCPNRECGEVMRQWAPPADAGEPSTAPPPPVDAERILERSRRESAAAHDRKMGEA